MTKSAEPITYQQALRRLSTMNVPREKALSLLNTQWKRGEYGRPYLDAPARQVLSKAGVRPAVRYEGINIDKSGKPTKQVPYLTPDQVRALRAAKMLPPGAWAHAPGVGGSVYVVSAGY
jgi:hypothetical protein